MKSFGTLYQFCLALALFVLTGNAADTQIHYLSSGEDPAVFVKSKIDSHEVMVFARSYGPHNRQTKDLLKKLQKNTNFQVEFLDIDLLPGFDSSLIMLELQQVTGQWALPNIFIGKKHVGGNSELDQMHALGELEEMLRKAGQEL